MDDKQFLIDYLDRYRQSIFETDVKAKMIDLKDLMKAAHVNGKKVIIAGNGGSAAIAAHCAVDLTKNAGIRCVNFSDPSLVTCLANDYGYERWVEKALEFYGDEGDLVILVSSSGKSPNMVRAAEFACRKGYKVATFTGFAANNPLSVHGHLNFWVDSRAYNIVETTHQIWLLAVCDLIIGSVEHPAS